MNPRPRPPAPAEAHRRWLQLLDTDVKLPPLTFSASWLSSPDTVAIERVAQLARQIAQSSVAVDAAATARH